MIDDLIRLMAVIGVSSAAVALLLSIVCALLDSDAAAAEERDVARLTRLLPGGKHRPENAPGTRTQRRLDDTGEIDMSALDELLAVAA